jgi:peptide/nickel transport system substrate-binding protein
MPQASKRFLQLSTISEWTFLLCVLLGHLGCGGKGFEPPADYAVVGLESGPVTLDPRYATDATGSQIGELLFDGLTRVDDRGRYRPDLAADWANPDPLTYEFHLRQGFRFHDGTPVTAVDVKATFDSIRSSAARSPKREELAAITAIEAPETYTVRFHLREPFAPFLDATTIGILPARAVAAAATTPIGRPIGSGAFRLQEFVPDDRVVLARYSDYAAGPVGLAGVVFRVIPDGLVRLLELKRGVLDLIQNAVEPDAVEWVRRLPNVRVLVRPSTTFQYLGLNLRDPRLADLRVRRAIACALDRRALIRSVLHGLATPATGLLAPSHWAYAGDGSVYSYNPRRAAALLDRAGYPDPDGDGPVPRFRLSYKTTPLELRRRIAEAVQAQLARVGIALDIRTYEWGTFYGDIKRGNFQLYSLAWVGVADPDIYFLTLHSSQVPPKGNNRGFFRDKTIDALTERARHTLDMGERRRFYGEIQRRVSELLPVIPLWWPTNVAVVSRRLHGFELQMNASLESLRDAWIEPH